MPPAGAHARPRRKRLENKTVRLPNLCLPQEGVGLQWAPPRTAMWVEQPPQVVVAVGLPGGVRVGLEEAPLPPSWRADSSSSPHWYRPIPTT